MHPHPQFENDSNKRIRNSVYFSFDESVSILCLRSYQSTRHGARLDASYSASSCSSTPRWMSSLRVGRLRALRTLSKPEWARRLPQRLVRLPVYPCLGFRGAISGHRACSAVSDAGTSPLVCASTLDSDVDDHDSAHQRQAPGSSAHPNSAPPAY
jgi:hypothetical protein